MASRPILVVLLAIVGSRAQYSANWESIDSRPLPLWYDQAKVGIFLHWGVYAVPGYDSEWFWWNWQGAPADNILEFMAKNYPPDFTYQDFAKDFTVEFFDPVQWADLFVASGAKYVVLTAKHHEGYCLWPSKHSYSWNSYDVGPKRDLVGEVAEAVRDAGLHFGLYHSLLEFFNPIYTDDRDSNFTTTEFPETKAIPELKELVNVYRPEIIWSDGEWDSPNTYWKSAEFLAWVYSESPVKDFVVVNDRWGLDTKCLHGGFYTCIDRYLPGELQPRKWENAMTIDRGSWGYRRNMNLEDLLSIQEILQLLVQTVSFGGNILINVGPTKEGTIAPIFQERLLQLGEWLMVNGEAIYESSVYSVQNDPIQQSIFYTAREDLNSVYAISLEWPRDNSVTLGGVGDLFPDLQTRVTLLGNEEELRYELLDDGVRIDFPNKATTKSRWAWTLKITPN